MECAAGYNKGIWIHAAYHTNPVVDSSSQMALIKDVRRLFLSYGDRGAHTHTHIYTDADTESEQSVSNSGVSL